MTWGIVLIKNGVLITIGLHNSQTHPLIATTHRAPLTGSFKKAKSRDGSHISVRLFGRYPPTDDVIFFVSFMECRRKLDLGVIFNQLK